MRISIGNFIGIDQSVRVTFKDGDFVHSRHVNAVVDADGNYDKAATRARIDEVAAGVAAKRARGVFDSAPPAVE